MTEFPVGIMEEIVGTTDVRTDADREAEAVGEVGDIRYCACGCGEALKPTAKHTYVRGHKLAALEGRSIPKDPDPPANNSKTNPQFPGDNLTAAVRQDIEAKLEFFLSLGGFTWESRDPICGREFNDRTELLAKKLVPIIAKSPELLKFFSAGGGISDWMEVGIVLWPIGKMVFRHHVIHSIEEEIPDHIPADLQYPV